MNLADPLRTRVAIILVILIVLIGACGDSDDSDDVGQSEPTAEPTSAALPTAEPTTATEPMVTVTGYVVDDRDRTRLCEVLAESFPPQCGGTSYDLVGLDLDAVTTTAAESVTWTDERVTIVGTIDGTTVSVIEVTPGGPTQVSVTVTGFVVDDGARSRLCEVLAESFPPQCGGTSYDLVGLDLDAVTTTAAEGVTWTDAPVIVTGTVDGETLTVIDVEE